MILFGLYTGQRLADVATLRWSNVDLVKGEIRLRTRKTDKVMILPIAVKEFGLRKTNLKVRWKTL